MEVIKLFPENNKIASICNFVRADSTTSTITTTSALIHILLLYNNHSLQY